MSVTSTTRLTKTQLIAKIERLEAELGLTQQECARLQAEVNALYQAQRPSREQRGDFVNTVAVQPPADARIVVIKGVRHYKTVAWEGGRKVATYRVAA